jgi:hypothetical protein
VTDTPEPDTAADSPEPDQEAPPVVRSEATDEFWQEVSVEPIRLALPGGQVGYTLRAYRPASQLTPTEPAPADGNEEPDPFAERERARAAEDAAREEELLAEATAGADPETAALTGEEPAPEEFADEDEPADEEMPVFLSHRGKLLLFGSPESLVAFLGSDAPHDLAQLDTWATVTKRVRPADIVPNEEDVYELDLVVENLRGGHDAWDLTLLIAAGELARDVGQALRLTPVITAMAPGSPLDDLDEALRAAAAGGVGGMFARRRLRRIGAQQASLGWRTVIGKVTAAVDWRD